MIAAPHPGQDMSTANENRQRAATNLREMMSQLDAMSTTQLPTHTLSTEKPIHTAIAYMMAAGRKRSEIAEATGVGVASISELSRQPWFRKRLAEIADSAGKDMVKSFLEGEVLPSLEVLRDIRDNSKEKGATRVTACNSILDRFMGKPVAHIESESTLNIHTAGRAAETVESELDKINAELRARGVKMTTGTN